jgi:hypothetical protein
MAWPKANPTGLKIIPHYDFSSCKTRKEIITLPWIMSRGFSQKPLNISNHRGRREELCVLKKTLPSKR